MGTPNYVAPEVVLGQGDDARIDQYSLAMTVHEVLTGSNCMEGPTPSATMVNQTKLEPPALSGLIPGVPDRTAEAVRRGLSKDPDGRFESCTAFAREVLAEVPSGTIVAPRRDDRRARGCPERARPRDLSRLCEALAGRRGERGGAGPVSPLFRHAPGPGAEARGGRTWPSSANLPGPG